MNQTSPYKSAYRSEIDGLRAFAVLSVVAFHAFPNWLKGGFIGVDVFFVISGFLITTHIFEHLDKGQFSFTDFFGRRIRRIFPALILVMVCSLAFGWFVLLADEFNQLGKHILSGAAFVSNFVFASEVGYFDTASELKPMLHLWSLALEEQFYIFWPLLLWITWKLRQNLLLVCLLFLIVSFLLNIIWVERFPTEVFFWPFGRFWELIVGSVLAWLILYKAKLFKVFESQNQTSNQKLANFLRVSNHSGATTAFGLILLIGSVLAINKSDPFPSYTAIFPVLGAALVVVGGRVSSFARMVLSNRLAVWFGLISYPLYLWHWPILSYLHIIEDGTPHRDQKILAVLVSILFAWFTYQFVEKPIRFRGSKKKFRTIVLVIFVFVIGLFGLIINYFDFKDSKGVHDVYLRKGLEHRIGSSSRWYNGVGGWLFLGNSYNQTVEKLKLTKMPSEQEVSDFKEILYELSSVGNRSNTQIALLVGPNKSSIYGDKLPAEISVSPTRYVNFFLNELSDIPNLTVYDPTDDLIEVKRSDGLLYYRTDTHWNDKGAYIAFRNLLSKLGFESPKVNFYLKKTVGGDLIEISNLNEFPLENDDTWLGEIDHAYEVIRKKEGNATLSDVFKAQELVINSNPIIDKKVWVIGDSFTGAVKPYFEATFSEIHYLGHWDQKLDSLVSYLKASSEKPDLIVMVRVERSF